MVQVNENQVAAGREFVDFVDSEADCSLLHNDVLESYDGLYIMKSISKSYGVPGLRLGVLASSDKGLISKIKKEVSIWNINSFAEFYMQIFGNMKAITMQPAKSSLPRGRISIRNSKLSRICE